ncbi:MAG: hypothetical protein E6R03_17440 [Hyphomicrobiaceae bacterium]|nr:MAG: hypothetical protein E6R03_17440 [Hyphomicrobiaceae bacterium]
MSMKKKVCAKSSINDPNDISEVDSEVIRLTGEVEDITGNAKMDLGSIYHELEGLRERLIYHLNRVDALMETVNRSIDGITKGKDE